MPNPRKQKFVRGIPADPLKLQPRDIALLCDVAEFRFLNTPQILALHSGGKRNLLRLLASLFEHGYLDRPKQQTSARLGSSHLIYSLGRKGAAAIIGNAGEREGVYRRLKENEQTLPLIAHSLMVSQFRVCLMLALKKHSDIKLTRWVQGNDLKSALRKHGEHPPLVADAFFVLETPTHKYPCFLEADRATMTQERFVSKLKMYWRHNREESFKDSLGIGAEEAKRYDPRTNCLTFNAWGENGYVVRKGEKAIKSFIIVEKKDEKTGEVVEKRLKNIFLFYEKQVEKLPA